MFTESSVEYFHTIYNFTCDSVSFCNSVFKFLTHRRARFPDSRFLVGTFDNLNCECAWQILCIALLRIMANSSILDSAATFQKQASTAGLYMYLFMCVFIDLNLLSNFGSSKMLKACILGRFSKKIKKTKTQHKQQTAFFILHPCGSCFHFVAHGSLLFMVQVSAVHFAIFIWPGRWSPAMVALIWSPQN